MHSCTKIFEFAAAHRIPQHKGKCRKLHGHQYRVEVTFTSGQLDINAMVIDFGDIKKRIGEWINLYWDHNTILSTDDVSLGNSISLITKQEIYYMDTPPTAEAMAHHLMKLIRTEIMPDLLQQISCSRVRIYETSTSYADATD